MHVVGQGLQVVHGLLVTQVARAQYVLNAAWHEKALEALGQTM